MTARYHGSCLECGHQFETDDPCGVRRSLAWIMPNELENCLYYPRMVPVQEHYADCPKCAREVPLTETETK